MLKSLLALVFLFAPASAVAETLLGQASVIDGDTLEIHGQRIRLAGVDAPESRQLCSDAAGGNYRCGKAAAFALSERIGQAVVRCVGASYDRFKRLIAICSASGVNLNGWLVEEGYAVAYRLYSKAYIAQEDAARTAKLRLWAGAFEMPWNWRAHH